MPIRARYHLRRMRGGAQAHLIECDDGYAYVVKFATNPQHRRILPNELLASELLKFLQISAPETMVVEIDEDFIRNSPEACMQLGTKTIPPEPGWHFGSRFPGDPTRVATYDFLPDQLVGKVHNLREFLGALVFDKWTGNSDGRQAIFFRAQISQWLPLAEENPRRMGFVAMMIDHGYILNGPHWELINSPVQGLYGRRMVYNAVRSLDDFQPWLDRVVHFPEHVVDEALRHIPSDWLRGDEDAFDKVLDALYKRRKRVPDLIADARLAKVNPFANWSA
jgi:hypothetical protein